MGVLEGFLCQEFANLPVSWFSAATSTNGLPNWKTREEQMPSKEQQFRAVFGYDHRNSELYFTLSFIWSSEDMDITLVRTVLKNFFKKETFINASY